MCVHARECGGQKTALRGRFFFFSFHHVDPLDAAQVARPMQEAPLLTISLALKRFIWGCGDSTESMENKIRWTVHIQVIVMKQFKHRCLFFGVADGLLLSKFLTGSLIFPPCPC